MWERVYTLQTTRRNMYGAHYVGHTFPDGATVSLEGNMCSVEDLRASPGMRMFDLDVVLRDLSSGECIEVEARLGSPHMCDDAWTCSVLMPIRTQDYARDARRVVAETSKGSRTPWDAARQVLKLIGGGHSDDPMALHVRVGFMRNPWHVSTSSWSRGATSDVCSEGRRVHAHDSRCLAKAVSKPSFWHVLPPPPPPPPLAGSINSINSINSITCDRHVYRTSPESVAVTSSDGWAFRVPVELVRGLSQSRSVHVPYAASKVAMVIWHAVTGAPCLDVTAIEVLASTARAMGLDTLVAAMLRTLKTDGDAAIWGLAGPWGPRAAKVVELLDHEAWVLSRERVASSC